MDNMTLFSSESIWLIALGKSILHSVWIGLLLLGLMKLILIRIPHSASRMRYGISVCTLLLLALSSVALFLVFYQPEALVKQPILQEEASSILSIRHKSRVFFAVSSYIYLSGVLFMGLRMISSLYHIRSLRNSGITAGTTWQEYLSGLSTKLGIKRKVSLLESYLVSGPVLVGFLKPAVIVPVGMLTNLPLSQIETILCHELYHLKRNDYLVNLMQLLLESLLFYNPGVWMISGIIRNERELCCDDRVIHTTGNPVNYAKALVHLAEQQQQSRMAPGAAGNSRHHLLSRISRILNTNTMKTNMREKVISLLLVAASVLLLMIVSGFSAGPSFVKQHQAVPDPARYIVSTLPAILDTIPAKVPEEAAKPEEPAKPEEAVEAEEAAIASENNNIVEIDWEQLKLEMEEVRVEMKADLESARAEMDAIDWDEVKKDLHESVAEMEIDMEKIKADIETSMKEIDWDQIKKDMEETMIHLDSLCIDLDR
jgi:bla regulator protein BlaR1